MKQNNIQTKSRFVTFILSFLPGLAHFYLGYADRAITYLGIIVMGLIASVVMGVTLVGGFALVLFTGGYLLVGLIALIDAFSLINKGSMHNSSENFSHETNSDFIQGGADMQNASFLNKKLITLALSIVPGAGHMYLGQQKKGLSFMTMFFATIFFMGWLRLNFLIFLLPVIWFYVFFDAFHLVNGQETEDFDIVSFLPQVSNSLIGKVLIGLGVVVIFNNIFYPVIRDFLDYRLVNYMQTSIVAIILIIIGIKMLKTKKEILRGDQDED